MADRIPPDELCSVHSTSVWACVHMKHPAPRRMEDSPAFVAARMLRALAQAREDTLAHCDYWDSLTKGPTATTNAIREKLCLCTPDAPAHDHSTGGYR